VGGRRTSSNPPLLIGLAAVIVSLATLVWHITTRRLDHGRIEVRLTFDGVTEGVTARDRHRGFRR
jgi:hypothetical protein